MREGSPQATYLTDYTPPAFLVDHIGLRFELDAAATVVRASLDARRNAAASRAGEALVLDGEALTLEGVWLDGEPLAPSAYAVDEASLTIHRVPERFRLELVTRIAPRENTALEGLYTSGDLFCTQCEAQGFRRITYFLDRPDVMATYTTTLEAERAACPVLLSNGNLVEAGEAEAGRHFATWHDPYPKPCYLFALVAGQLVCREATYRTHAGREVALRLFTEAHNADKCEHALASLSQAMRWDEHTFGLEYDLDTYMVVAVDDFNMGAMENKGLNIFNSKYVLARPETATDEDYENIQAVIGHEYFHNWTGNRVTCRDWFQLSLKEGLTVFREQEFAAQMTSPAVQRIADARALRSQQFPEDAGPMAHPVRPQSYIEINNFYTATVYEKGAEVVRMIQTLVGRAGFRDGLRLYLERHDGQAATTEDFVAAMADANGVDLEQFKRWYEQAGTPVVTVSGAWNGAEQTYTLSVTQDCPATPDQPNKRPLHIPLAMGLLDSDGRATPLRLAGEARAVAASSSRVLEVSAREQAFTFVDVSAAPVPSLLRGFSAPVVLRYEYTDGELGFLAAHDSDPFSRWEAGQQLAVRVMRRLIADYEAGRALVLDRAVIAAFEQTLGDASLDKALVVEALTLPAETYLAEQLQEVDVDAIHAVREHMRVSLAGALETRLCEVYREHRRSGPYAYTAEAAAARRLRGLCLAYLTALGTTEYDDLALAHFSSADNMTDTMGALHALNDRACAQREGALEAFHDAWRHDALVMDKWLALCATSALTGTLERVRELRAHPQFSRRNPNKVRALIGAFAHRNPVGFHQRSGEGYRLIADEVLSLDPLNPQVAARLAKAFSRWQRYDPERQRLMRAELERLAATKDLSRDVYEVVSRSLG